MTQPAKEQQLPSLGGILGSSRSSVRSSSSSAPHEAQTPAKLPVADRKVERPAAKATAAPVREEASERARPTTDSDTGYLLPRSIYLPRTLHKNATAFAKENDTTVTALVLDAVNEVHGELGAYFVAQAPSDRKPGHLFAVPQKKGKAGERTFQTTMRVTDEQLVVLDELASAHAVDRSKLVSVALRLYIEPLMPNAVWTAR